MAKSVLGNDPFVRGAALRPIPPPEEKQPEAGKTASKHAPRPSVQRTTRAPAPQQPPIDVNAATPVEPVAPAPAVEPLPAAPTSPPEAPAYSTTAHGHGLSDKVRQVLALVRAALEHGIPSPTFHEAFATAHSLARALGLGSSGEALPDLYGRDSRLVEQLAGLMEFLYSRYWRVSVEGAHHIPAGPVLIVANHAGAIPLDGPVLAEAIRRERPHLKDARWLLEDQIFYAPFFGTLFNRLGGVRACPENATRLLEEKRPVLVFPEGIQGISKPFRERYVLKRFGRGGFVKIALRTGVPIVPAAIVGSEETLPLLAKLPVSALGLPYFPVTPLGPLPLPAKWMIRFGEPVLQGGPNMPAADDFARVQELTEATRHSIDTMLQALRHNRKGSFTG